MSSAARRDLPPGWELLRLDACCDFMSGGTPSKANAAYWEGSIPWVSPKDMKSPTLADAQDHISEEALRVGSALAPAGSVFVVVRGMILARDVPVALAKVPMAFNQDMKAVVARHRVEPGFLLYALMASKEQLFQVVGRSAHGTRTLQSEAIESVEILVPERDEQRAIVAILDAVRRAVECQEGIISSSRELKQAAMARVLAGSSSKEQTKQSPVGDVPQSWVVNRLDFFCDVVSSRLSYEEFRVMQEAGEMDVEAMAVKVSDMNRVGNEDRFISAAQQKRIPRSIAEARLIPPETVVLPKRGAAIATNKKRLTTTWTALDPNLIGVKARGERLSPAYLFYWLQNFDLRTITEPGPTPQLNKKDLVPLMMAIPTNPREQRAIVDLLASIDRAIKMHERKRALLVELFDRLLDDLTSGRRRASGFLPVELAKLP